MADWLFLMGACSIFFEKALFGPFSLDPQHKMLPRRMTAQRALRSLQEMNDSSSEDNEIDEVNDDSDSVENSDASSEGSDENLSFNDEALELTHDGIIPESTRTSATSTSKSGITWHNLSTLNSVGRLSRLHVMSVRPGPTSYATSRIVNELHMSAWRLLVDEPMLRHIQKCTIERARSCGEAEWSVSLYELNAFLDLFMHAVS